MPAPANAMQLLLGGHWASVVSALLRDVGDQMGLTILSVEGAQWGATDLALGTKTIRAINPDILGHDLPLLGKLHVLLEL